MCVLVWTTMFLSIAAGVLTKAIYFYLLFFILSATIIVMILKRRHEDPKCLEIICVLNIAVNLGTTLTYLLAYM